MHRRAFTLLELIVVSAVILVLAAVALPNFLEAKTRAEVARVRADQKTLRDALESYRIDNGFLPEHISAGGFNFWYAFGWEITTPIAYISSRDALEDPFASPDGFGVSASLPGVASIIEDEYLYVNWEMRDRDMIDGRFITFSIYNNPQWYGAVKSYRKKDFGDWEIASRGPMREFDSAIDPSTRYGHYFLLYDPTNGTISDGAIVRSGASAEGVPLSGYVADGLPGE